MGARGTIGSLLLQFRIIGLWDLSRRVGGRRPRTVLYAQEQHAAHDGALVIHLNIRQTPSGSFLIITISLVRRQRNKDRIVVSMDEWSNKSKNSLDIRTLTELRVHVIYLRQ
jgi:hypothetical protein